MINPLDELSDIYLGQISEADNSPEAIKARVMQHVRAIRYRARKEGDQLNKAYNDYMAGQAGISATEKSMVKERLGLTGGAQHQEGMAYGLSRGTGKPSGPMAAFGKKKTKKTKPTVTIDKPDKLVSLRVSKEGYYSWRHELSEYSGMMPKKNGDAEARITEKKVKNKVTVNPAQGQAESFAKELGGQLLEACEVFQILEVDDDQIQLLEVKDRKGKGSGTKDACYHKVKSRYSVWPSAYASGALVKCRRVGAANWGNSTKKEDVQWKDIKYKAKSGESTFLSDSDGNIAFEIVDVIAPAVAEEKKPMVKVKLNPSKKIGVKVTDIGPGGKEVVRKNTMDEDYETKKKEEIMGALKKRDLKQKVKEKIAADIIKRKGDVSKSDDRYAYESVESTQDLDEKCWPGYEKKGMKTMFGKRYPNCVKKKTNSEEVEFQEKLDLKKADMGDVVKDFYKSDAPQFKGRSKEKRREMAIAAKLTAERGKLPEEVETVDEAKYEKGASDYGKTSIRNKRAFGKGGNARPPEERGAAKMLRHDAHQKRRFVKKNNKYGATNKPPVYGAPSDEFKKDRYATKEAYSANPAQQAAIAIAKKERKQDLKVSQKKKMKEEIVTELNRFEKEKGVDTKTGKPVTKGGTAKNDRAFQSVMKRVGKQRMGANQPKKVRGAKNPNETSPTKQKMTRMKAAKASSRAFETRAKRAGYKTAQDYANVVARYGSEDNMKKGRGLGT